MDKKESIQKDIEKAWKHLNEYGIYTEDQLKKISKELELDIGIFTTPYDKQ